MSYGRAGLAEGSTTGGHEASGSPGRKGGEGTGTVTTKLLTEGVATFSKGHKSRGRRRRRGLGLRRADGEVVTTATTRLGLRGLTCSRAFTSLAIGGSSSGRSKGGRTGV